MSFWETPIGRKRKMSKLTDTDWQGVRWEMQPRSTWDWKRVWNASMKVIAAHGLVKTGCATIWRGVEIVIIPLFFGHLR